MSQEAELQNEFETGDMSAAAFLVYHDFEVRDTRVNPVSRRFLWVFEIDEDEEIHEYVKRFYSGNGSVEPVRFAECRDNLQKQIRIARRSGSI